MQLDARFRFDTFVVGASNRLAAAAARAVADAPGATYNPLVVYGGSGLGKTHLAGAIAHRAREREPGLRVEYATLDELVDELHAAVAAGRADALHARWGGADVLVVDDVQFVTGRRETQAELLRLLEALQGQGRQIVLTSDRPPTDIPDVDERLLSRLAGGLVVDVGAPDYETRLAIARNAAAARGAEFSAGVLEELAKLPVGNVRELQGALNRLAATQALDGAALRPGDVRAVLGAALAPRPGDPPPAEGDLLGGLLDDVARAVEAHVSPWRVRLGEAAERWASEGIATGVLDRAMRLAQAPDIDGLLGAFASAVERLRALEREGGDLDAALAGHGAFRDPERVAEAEALVARARAGADPLPAPDPARTRATLADGDRLRAVLAAVDEMAAAPASRWNPLYVCAPAGAERAHVLHAAAHALAAELARRGDARAVACVDGAAFAEELVAALQKGGAERWRRRWRAAGALVIDGVDALAGRERTQEELFHLFEALAGAGRQVVLSGERAPGALQGLEDRLRSRFGGGLVVTLDAPARESGRAARRAPEAAPAAPASPPRPRGATAPVAADAEHFVLDWPDVAALLADEVRA